MGADFSIIFAYFYEVSLKIQYKIKKNTFKQIPCNMSFFPFKILRRQIKGIFVLDIISLFINLDININLNNEIPLLLPIDYHIACVVELRGKYVLNYIILY